MKTIYAFHFPDGRVEQQIETSYCPVQFHIGEKVIVEDNPSIWVIKDIQHQFRIIKRSFTEYKLIMVNVMLEKIK